MNENFNWFENDIDAELEEFEQSEYKRSTFSFLFDLLSSQIGYVLLFFVGLRIIYFVFRMSNLSLFGIDFFILLNNSIFILGSFVFIYVLVKCTVYVCLNVRVNSMLEFILGSYRLIILSIWSLVNLSWFKANMNDVLGCYYYLRAFFASVLVTSIAYNITSVIMIFFDRYFVNQTLKAKINDVEKTEKIISSMKTFRYEIGSSSSVGSQNCPCQDIYCYDMSSSSHLDNLNDRSLEDLDIQKTYLDIPEPELHSISDAKTLAKDVFVKASGNGKSLTVDEFNTIFANPQTAINAFFYFDNGIDKSIKMKTFHDTIMTFYMERIYLEKSVRRAEEFVSIIGTFFNVFVFFILCLIYLILFGAPLKELLALALSSALALNFIASGMATDQYYNFMMLLSHQFDVGDEVIVDGDEYKVYTFGLTSTSLLCENGGKVKFLNSELWKKKLINMTRAPEKILVFKFSLNPNISHFDFSALKLEIHNYVVSKRFDFLDTFSLQAESEKNTSIENLECSLILKCKTFKNKTKKFNLRVETTHFLNEIIKKYAN
ncbi:mechanosensitive channel of small conductance (MscS1A) [Vairimorpha necatrix]|uniref:Mechanosensitive channel of small conductance (MscS1A) n=1 Tax=Vairimorpha necatrix TaxID=6039 RepID=A0AAX4JDX5_9MICR